MTFLDLPPTLLILIHLHLLNYPLQDATGYDENLFDPHRGIRERSKAMEDIGYFLVESLEGGRTHAKAVLPTYPCLRPSDNNAFRISLSKYLENLRHCALYGNGASEDRNKDKLAAWWWKDVVVRKSTLEECCGGRFESLLLALSTHALLRHVVRRSAESLIALEEKTDLHALDRAYADILASSQAARLSWESSATLLHQRCLDLLLLRERLADPGSSSNSKNAALSTDRLLKLRDARYNDLLEYRWKTPGRKALERLIEMAGLVGTTTSEDSNLRRDIPQRLDSVQAESVSLLSASLPITAARHPTHIRGLSAPLFPKRTLKSEQSSESETHRSAADTTLVVHGLSERMEAAKRTQAALQEALARAERTQLSLESQLKTTRASVPPPRVSKADVTGDAYNLWTPPASTKPVLNIALIHSNPPASLSKNESLEERIAHIRTHLLPPYPSIPSSPPAPNPSTLRHPSTREARSLRDITDAPSLSTTQETKQHDKMSVQARTAPSSLLPRTQDSEVKKAPTLKAGMRAQATDAGRSSSFRRPSKKLGMAQRPTVQRGPGIQHEVDKIVRAVRDDSPSEDRLAPPRTVVSRGTPLATAKTPGARFLPAKAVMDEVSSEDSNEEVYEGQSVTLADILLRAGDATRIELLQQDELDDMSFAWE